MAKTKNSKHTSSPSARCWPTPPAELHLLEVMAGTVSRSLAATPVEEEEITTETAAALERARASLARGEGIPHEDILREFGLDK